MSTVEVTPDDNAYNPVTSFANYLNSQKIPPSLRIMSKFINVLSYPFPRSMAWIISKIFQKPFKSRTKSFNPNSPVHSYFSTIRDEEIQIHEAGTGPRVLLVHGWASSSSRFNKLAEELVKSGYGVVAFDLPAHGNSSGSLTNLYECGYTIDEIGLLYGEFEAIVTHSFGGTATLFNPHKEYSVGRIITVAMPSRLDSLVDPFLHYLNFSQRIKPYFLKRLEIIAKRPLSEFTPLREKFETSYPINIIHDLKDHIIPYSDAILFSEKINAAPYKTEELGHRKIISDKNVIDFIIETIKTTETIKLST